MRQQAISSRCTQPTDSFLEFTREDIEQSIAERFEKQVRLHPYPLAVKSKTCQLTYKMLNPGQN